MGAEEGERKGKVADVCGLEGSLQDLNGVVLGCDIFEAFRATEVCPILVYVLLFFGKGVKVLFLNPGLKVLSVFGRCSFGGGSAVGCSSCSSSFVIEEAGHDWARRLKVTNTQGGICLEFLSPMLAELKKN